MKKKNATVEVVCGFKIREPTPGRFVLQVRRKGLTLHESFASLAAARSRCEQLHIEQTEEGLRAFELPKRDRLDATEALKRLNGRATLAEAVAFWCDHHPDGSAMTLRGLTDTLLADLVRRNCRPRSLSNVRHRLGKLCHDYGERPVCTITAEELDQWLDVRGGGITNRDNFRRAFRAAWNFAKKKGVVTVNPVEAIDRIKGDATMPVHWSADQVAAVLRAAESFQPDIVPALAVMAFAGLRPDETAHLRWEHVNLAERIIRVMPHTSKTRQSRAVTITDNLALWLAPYHRKGGPLAPKPGKLAIWRIRAAMIAQLGEVEVRRRLAQHEGKKGTEIRALKLRWRDMVAEARKTAGDLWPQDVLRHSYATHWLAQHKDLPGLAVLMGNSQDVIMRHYRGLATEGEAAAYWAIEPSKAGVIQLKTA